MKYTVKPTTRFARDVKRAEKRGCRMELLTEVVRTLAEGRTLPEKNKDHPLTEDFAGLRECHIAPDWLLIYKAEEEDLILYLMRTGTHSDLF